MVAGLILAAGGGSRFGSRPKQLALLAGRPLLQYAIDSHVAVAELDHVVVVLGAAAAEVLDVVSLGRAEVVICERWGDGQAASLRAGIAAVGAADRVVCTLGDQPMIGPAVISRLALEPAGSRAAYYGRPGHPVVLGPAHMAAIHSLEGDHGGRFLLEEARLVECAELGSDRDVDTREDLVAMQRLVIGADVRSGED